MSGGEEIADFLVAHAQSKRDSVHGGRGRSVASERMSARSDHGRSPPEETSGKYDIEKLESTSNGSFGAHATTSALNNQAFFKKVGIAACVVVVAVLCAAIVIRPSFIEAPGSDDSGLLQRSISLKRVCIFGLVVFIVVVAIFVVMRYKYKY